MPNRQILVEIAIHRNIYAMQHVIREKESSQQENAYTILNGGAHFEGFSKHPGFKGGPAAGAYQFVFSTWEEEAARWNLTDFSPASQDLGCIARFIYRNALQEILTGKFEAAIVLLRKEWTSLPGAAESRQSWTLDKAKAIYLSNNGLLFS